MSSIECRVNQPIKDNASSPARELEDTIFKAVVEFSRGAEQADDIAVLVVEFH